jgi:xanthine dehydrogenase small subunit
MLLNSNFSEDILLKAQKGLEKDFQPIDDMRASKDYRIEIAKNLLTKCFAEIKKNKLIRLSY